MSTDIEKFLTIIDTQNRIYAKLSFETKIYLLTNLIFSDRFVFTRILWISKENVYEDIIDLLQLYVRDNNLKLSITDSIVRNINTISVIPEEYFFEVYLDVFDREYDMIYIDSFDSKTLEISIILDLLANYSGKVLFNTFTHSPDQEVIDLYYRETDIEVIEYKNLKNIISEECKDTRNETILVLTIKSKIDNILSFIRKLGCIAALSHEWKSLDDNKKIFIVSDGGYQLSIDIPSFNKVFDKVLDEGKKMRKMRTCSDSMLESPVSISNVDLDRRMRLGSKYYLNQDIRIEKDSWEIERISSQYLALFYLDRANILPSYIRGKELDDSLEVLEKYGLIRNLDFFELSEKGKEYLYDYPDLNSLLFVYMKNNKFSLPSVTLSYLLNMNVNKLFIRNFKYDYLEKDNIVGILRQIWNKYINNDREKNKKKKKKVYDWAKDIGISFYIFNRAVRRVKEIIGRNSLNKIKDKHISSAIRQISTLCSDKFVAEKEENNRELVGNDYRYKIKDVVPKAISPQDSEYSICVLCYSGYRGSIERTVTLYIMRNVISSFGTIYKRSKLRFLDLKPLPSENIDILLDMIDYSFEEITEVEEIEEVVERIDDIETEELLLNMFNDLGW